MLEASYIIFLLKPYYKNFNKRMTKTPKLYFYDTGLACSLLGIRSAKDVSVSPFRGALFKSGETVTDDYFKSLINWSKLAETDPANGYIVYGGTAKQARRKGTVINWMTSGDLIAKLEDADA